MNNEDNRQMTVIAAEIERQKTILKGIQENHDSLSGDIAANKVKHTISVLESLLPKEESMIIDAFDNGQANYSLPRDVDDGKQYFNQTFKTHEHGK